MKIRAHAKINLSLRILGKRDDGFHEIETLMVGVSLHDMLNIERLTHDAGWQFSCSRKDLESPHNLVHQAVRLIEYEVGRPLPVRIELDKRIPSGAGLGGGSSDAAATLRGLNALFELELTRHRLFEMAAELGSDVPFFLWGGPCLCRGRGEQVSPSERFLETRPLVLFKLPIEIPTSWAYQYWAKSREVDEFTYAPQALGWATLENDLERPVYAKFLILGQMKRWLLGQPEVDGALMSGSGSALFAVLKAQDGGPPLIDRAHSRYGEQLWTFSDETMPG